ncbi:MAG: helix-turn-helix transcriptional regulator [Mucilaginibacter sp.]|nr:helix-turn-helix transcriptional regulator [Mucilaginibacter sp.]
MDELYIKNMVCDRCKMVVSEALIEHGFQVINVELGRVTVEGPLSVANKIAFGETLKKFGFDLLDDSRSRTIEKLKKIIIQKIHHAEILDISVNWSVLLARELKADYKHLSSLFSGVEGTTLEQYITRQKIERVKECLFYDELNLNEISYKMGYSSAQHLSAQFKRITGQTPSQFKASRSSLSDRRSLDRV